MNQMMSGVDVISHIVDVLQIKTVFAYPGTSELQLCNAIAALKNTKLYNARGDKEALFMAGGGGLLSPAQSCSIIHAARGITNAAGGLAETLRDEAGNVVFLGLPTTTSKAFVPPHGEVHLLENIGAFAKGWHEFGAVPDDDAGRKAYAKAFLEIVYHAFDTASACPAGPFILGIPQDVADGNWFPRNMLVERLEVAQADNTIAPDVLDLITGMERPVIMLDDYALRYDGFAAALHMFSAVTGAPVMQLRYRRGAMLFERLRQEHVPNFIGWYDPWDAVHKNVMSQCDGLIILEDRNFYRRVVGNLPDVPIISVTSNRAKSIKNGFTGDNHTIVEGNVLSLLHNLSELLPSAPRDMWTDASYCPPMIECSPEVNDKRKFIVKALSAAMSLSNAPVLVDDSQMFGGLIASQYDALPPHLRIFGAHGGFVGSGISYATGLALTETWHKIFCTVGDQAFTNAIQGLVSAAEHGANVCFIVCNNGGSVSLTGQSNSENLDPLIDHGFLNNGSLLSYTALGQAIGLRTSIIREDEMFGSQAKRNYPAPCQTVQTLNPCRYGTR